MDIFNCHCPVISLCAPSKLRGTCGLLVGASNPQRPRDNLNRTTQTIKFHNIVTHMFKFIRTRSHLDYHAQGVITNLSLLHNSLGSAYLLWRVIRLIDLLSDIIDSSSPNKPTLTLIDKKLYVRRPLCTLM